MSTLPLAAARAQLSRLVEEAARTHERFEITRNGRRAAVLMSANDYDTLQDTLAVLSDPELIQAHAAGLEALGTGEVLEGEELTELMQQAGRLSGE